MSSPHSYKVSIIVVNWHTGSLVRKLVDHLVNNPPDISVELVVWDNSSHEYSETLENNKIIPVKWLNSPENIGFGRGVNRAFQHTQGEYIFISNPDILPLPGTLDKLYHTMVDNPQIALTVPILVNKNLQPIPSIRIYPTYLTIFMENSIFHSIPFVRSKLSRFRYFLPLNSGVEYVRDQPMGAAMMIHKTTFMDLGGFDENFFLFFEDVDLFTRFKKTGRKVAMDTGAPAIHLGGVSISKTPGSDTMFYEGYLRFYRKHKSLKKYLIARVVLCVGGIITACKGMLMLLVGKKDGSIRTGLNMFTVGARFHETNC